MLDTFRCNLSRLLLGYIFIYFVFLFVNFTNQIFSEGLSYISNYSIYQIFADDYNRVLAIRM